MPWILGAIGVAASALMVLAWWVGGSERALFADAVSLAIAVGLVTLAADIFEPRGRAASTNPSSPSKGDNTPAGTLGRGHSSSRCARSARSLGGRLSPIEVSSFAMGRALDFLAAGLLLSAAFTFAMGCAPWIRKEDRYALYWFSVGAVTLKCGPDLIRSGRAR